MAADRDRFSTATRIRALGEQAAARVYRAQNRRLRRPPRRSRLTGRAAVLALVVCSLIVALAYPLRQYVQQRAEVDDLRRQTEEERRRVEELRDEKARWQDPSYVEQQARERLSFLRPGETGFILPQERADEEDDGRRTSGAPAARPWYETLWERVDGADRTQ
ncbi:MULTISPECIES: septum formation initiator family protein [unclassified Streptomyces]|uniref:Septum formation initiator family protein n=1 Tax=Streptomyces johnsoniae TaxID=3075532 RepID=A0ABU2RZ23_9ACTN|nr:MULTISPECIES: septum formation initiator family protein [unclassified Streptomyces]MDT0441676.1 septum formation initiator family protein [Streptomyces sp. DSM 41886]ONK13813.1 Septum formation initiator [Streptomyces sp. MP131-18]